MRYVSCNTIQIIIICKNGLQLTFKSKLVDTGFKDALEGLSRTGTVVGAIAGGVPSLVNIIVDVHNGESVKVRDVINVTVAAGAVFVEFSGLGEAYDGTVGLITAGVGLVNDIINFF